MRSGAMAGKRKLRNRLSRPFYETGRGSNHGHSELVAYSEASHLDYYLLACPGVLAQTISHKTKNLAPCWLDEKHSRGCVKGMSGWMESCWKSAWLLQKLYKLVRTAQQINRHDCFKYKCGQGIVAKVSIRITKNYE